MTANFVDAAGGDPGRRYMDRRKTSKVQIKNVPMHIPREELELMLTEYGPVDKFEIVSSMGDVIVYVTYRTPDCATKAHTSLNNYEFQGSSLKVDYVSDGRQKFTPHSPPGPSRGSPLRLLVPSEVVGAIIGRNGDTIRQITTNSRARVDVQRNDGGHYVEKVISIYGQPDNVTNACKEIMNVVHVECVNNGGGEVSLKLLADDRFCGRIIGRKGVNIQQMREKTETRIHVSKFLFHSAQDAPSMFPDRVITVKGALDKLPEAQSAISNKLRECEQVLQARMVSGYYGGGRGGGPQMMGGPRGGPFGGPGGGEYGYYGGDSAQHGAPAPYHYTPMAFTMDQFTILVPNSAVGAIIGTGGANIKQIMEHSRASVTVERKTDEEAANPHSERRVTIKGSPEGQWKAGYYIFSQLAGEGASGPGARLRCFLIVAKAKIGRIIGRGGRNVRAIQNRTGAVVTVPEDQAQQGEETKVEVCGTFIATQNAIAQVRYLAASPPPMSQAGGGGPQGPAGAAATAQRGPPMVANGPHA